VSACVCYLTVAHNSQPEPHHVGFGRLRLPEELARRYVLSIALWTLPTVLLFPDVETILDERTKRQLPRTLELGCSFVHACGLQYYAIWVSLSLSSSPSVSLITKACRLARQPPWIFAAWEVPSSSRLLQTLAIAQPSRSVRTFLPVTRHRSSLLPGLLCPGLRRIRTCSRLVLLEIFIIGIVGLLGKAEEVIFIIVYPSEAIAKAGAATIGWRNVAVLGGLFLLGYRVGKVLRSISTSSMS
jgi:hypothetical protein